jgi:predicted GNAT family N-acyltransferase
LEAAKLSKNLMTKRTELPPMVQIQEITEQEQLRQAFAIREAVFVDEQQVDPAEEYDEYEELSRHFLLRAEGEAAATGRFRSTEKGWKIERMAVLKVHRGRGFGGYVLESMLAAIPRDGRPIYLHAQEHALAFYEKHHFLPEGERFFEANIPHFKCVYQMV